MPGDCANGMPEYSGRGARPKFKASKTAYFLISHHDIQRDSRGITR